MVRVGFTSFPCSFLGDVVFVELPPPGTEVVAGERIGVVESSTAVCEVAAPVSGTVAEVNPELETSPERITADPYGNGWLLLLRSSGPEELRSLLDAGQYFDYVHSSG
jgi:glycine cleavage system H protein